MYIDAKMSIQYCIAFFMMMHLEGKSVLIVNLENDDCWVWLLEHSSVLKTLYQEKILNLKMMYGLILLLYSVPDFLMNISCLVDLE